MKLVRRISPDRLVTTVAVVLIAVTVALGVAQTFDRGGLTIARDGVGNAVNDMLWFSLLCGLFASASLELVKRFGELRGHVQRDIVLRWVISRAHAQRVPELAAVDELVLALRGRSPSEDDTALEGPRHRYHGVGEVQQPDIDWRGLRKLFNAPPDVLAARIGSASDLALMVPWAYRALPATLFGRDDLVPEAAWMEGGEPTGRAQVVGAQRFQSALDELQLELGARWRRVVQLLAVALAGLYAIAFAAIADFTGSGSARYLFAGLLLGGPAAWAIRDITAVLERLRER